MGSDAHFAQEVGEFFGHALGEGGYDAALAAVDAQLYLVEQVVNLAVGGLDLDDGVGEAGGPDDLLDHLLGVFVFVGAGGGGDVDYLVDGALEFAEVEGAIVEGRGQAKAVFDQDLLAGAVAVVHGADLGQRHVGLVYEEQVVFGEVVHEGVGRAALVASAEVAGVVFDAGAVAGFAQHFDVVAGALFESLGLQQFARAVEYLPAVPGARPRCPGWRSASSPGR